MIDENNEFIYLCMVLDSKGSRKRRSSANGPTAKALRKLIFLRNLFFWEDGNTEQLILQYHPTPRSLRLMTPN